MERTFKEEMQYLDDCASEELEFLVPVGADSYRRFTATILIFVI